MNSHCVGSAEDLDGDFTDIINEPVSKPKKLKSEKSKKQSGQAKTTESKKGSFRALAWDTVHEASAVFSTYYQKATTKLTELEVEKQLNIPGTRLDHLVFLLCSHETKRTGFSLNLHLFLWVTGFLQIILMPSAVAQHTEEDSESVSAQPGAAKSTTRRRRAGQ